MCSRQHNSIKNEIDQTTGNKPQIQININPYINKKITQQIKFNAYQRYNDKERQRNKKKTATRQSKLNINTPNQLSLHGKKINIKQEKKQEQASLM